MLDNYYSIVEKTNQQLSLWYNPYGLMVGFVTLLFGIMAIIVSVILVRNSREQKQQQKEFFEEQKKLAKEQNEMAEKQFLETITEAKKELDLLIHEHQKKLASVDKTDKENKQKIEKELESLKRQKATLGLNLTTTPEYTFSNFFSQSNNMICSHCGKSFSYFTESRDPLRISITDSFNKNKHVYCSNCGAINIPL